MILSLVDGKEADIPSSDIQVPDNSTKQDKLLKEHEQLKQKLDKALRELASEKESKKTDKPKSSEDNKSTELQIREQEFQFTL